VEMKQDSGHRGGVEGPSRVLFIGGGAGSEPYLRALEVSGFECEHSIDPHQGIQRVRDDEDKFDLVIWDTEYQAHVLDEAFDKGRYRAKMPTLLLLERLYPWVAAQGRRPGALDYLVKPISPDDLAAAADQNVRVVKARRYVEYARKQVQDIAELLGRTRDLLGPTGFNMDNRERVQKLPLSDREEEIARALLKGHRVTHIARMLDISPHTVRNHFKSIFRKMQVHSQVELLARLREEFEDA